MALTPEQVKGRIKNYAKQYNADARVLLRIYMMERFLERIAASQYAEKFIIKGGILVTSLVGVSMRSTMDIDSTIRNLNLSEDEIAEIIEEISKIDLDDGVTFQITEVSPIMDEMEYPGIRLSLDALMGKMITPIKIDISTGDVITPRAIEYSYKLMLEDRAINLWTYNLETILAEKLQTVLVRGILNTRMRDFYDIHTLISAYGNRINEPIFRKAFEATCEKRGTPLSQSRCSEIIDGITSDDVLIKLWSNYQKKYSYASSISYESIMDSIKHLNTIATK